ncbi:MAG: DNA-3-methyladenine glycosylase I [Syntrophales bacterium]|jgi:DNA-3-methyladenine glycosylase I|nr:DNA-3-methyladenine glycosylase I [Syntrophales bacterium]
MKSRCEWAIHDPLFLDYHDNEWGVPVHDDRRLFEMLVLEGAQAGLNWRMILKRRKNYRRAFQGFDPEKIAAFTKTDIDRLMNDPGIIRNRRKIESAVRNAQALLTVIDEEGSFNSFIWNLAGTNTRHNSWTSMTEIPSKDHRSDTMSRELKKRGFSFAGSTICYAFMQSVGMVNDHVVGCFRHDELMTGSR